MIDLQLLALIQAMIDYFTESIAQQVGLSKTACWRRSSKARTSGFIKRPRRTCLDARSLGLGVSVFDQVRRQSHDGSLG